MTVIRTHRFEPPRPERLAFYVWLDGRGFYTGAAHANCWASHRGQAHACATRLIAQAIAEHHAGSVVMCCFAPGAAPDERRGYEPKVREYEEES